MFDADITYETRDYGLSYPDPGDPRNLELLRLRLVARAALPAGPHTGEWLRERDGSMSRITYVWELSDDSSVQAGGHASGSFYLGKEGGESYSGGLSRGVPAAELVLTDETAPGQVWFFDHDWPGAGRGVYYRIPERVWQRV